MKATAIVQVPPAAIAAAVQVCVPTAKSPVVETALTVSGPLPLFVTVTFCGLLETPGAVT